MGEFISILVAGVATGCLSALVALGFIVTYKATGVINFAQGGLVTLGAYLGYWLIVQVGVPRALAYVAALALMFCFGMVVERIAHRPLRSRPLLVVVIATLGIGLVIQSGLQTWQGSDPKHLSTPLDGKVLHVLGANIAYWDLLIVLVTAVVVTALMLMFSRTQIGRQFRAVSADPDVASLYGIPVARFGLIAFGLGGLLAGLAGLMMAPRGSLEISMGFDAMMTAFAAAVIGGFGRLGGVVIGALVLGLVQQLGSAYVSDSFTELYPFIVMIGVIAIWSQGILGSEERVRV
ncbi:MAG TPA: branched-chain amino acid ABC transporter permease [Conexibacter sp.]